MGSNPRFEAPYDLDPSHTALVGIDFQQAFGHGAWEEVPDGDAAIANFRRAAGHWRSRGGRVVMVREAYLPEDFPDEIRADVVSRHPLMLGSVNTRFHPGLFVDGDLEIRKKGFSAYAASALPTVLADHGWDTIVVGGLTTPICVTTTADGFSMAGTKVVVLSDACAAQSFEDVDAATAHRVALARLRYQFAQVISVGDFVDRT